MAAGPRNWTDEELVVMRSRQRERERQLIAFIDRMQREFEPVLDDEDARLAGEELERIHAELVAPSEPVQHLDGPDIDLVTEENIEARLEAVCRRLRKPWPPVGWRRASPAPRREDPAPRPAHEPGELVRCPLDDEPEPYLTDEDVAAGWSRGGRR